MTVPAGGALGPVNPTQGASILGGLAAPKAPGPDAGANANLLSGLAMPHPGGGASFLSSFINALRPPSNAGSLGALALGGMPATLPLALAQSNFNLMRPPSFAPAAGGGSTFNIPGLGTFPSAPTVAAHQQAQAAANTPGAPGTQQSREQELIQQINDEYDADEPNRGLINKLRQELAGIQGTSAGTVRLA